MKIIILSGFVLVIALASWSWNQYGNKILNAVELNATMDEIAKQAEVASHDNKHYFSVKSANIETTPENRHLVTITIEDVQYFVKKESNSLSNMLIMADAEKHYVYKPELHPIKGITISAVCFESTGSVHCLPAIEKIKNI